METEIKFLKKLKHLTKIKNEYLKSISVKGDKCNIVMIDNNLCHETKFSIPIEMILTSNNDKFLLNHYLKSVYIYNTKVYKQNITLYVQFGKEYDATLKVLDRIKSDDEDYIFIKNLCMKHASKNNYYIETYKRKLEKNNKKLLKIEEKLNETELNIIGDDDINSVKNLITKIGNIIKADDRLMKNVKVTENDFIFDYVYLVWNSETDGYLIASDEPNDIPLKEFIESFDLNIFKNWCDAGIKERLDALRERDEKAKKVINMLKELNDDPLDVAIQTIKYLS